VICRLYIPADFAHLYQIEEACFLPHLRFSRRTMRNLVQKSNSAAWIAEEAERMAGFVIVEWKQTRNGVIAYIHTIEVTPEARGLGVGGQLLCCAEASARAAGAVLLRLHVDEENQTAIRLYQANGFLYEGRIEDYYPQDHAAHLYSKRLDDRAA
jgi:ribosomal protein S18 acetylase RimI-like enzyme